MTTDADIGNMALSRLGTQATITSLTENSTEARQLNIWYATTRDGLLRTLDFNFSRLYFVFNQSGTPPDRWAYSYAFPVDCLKFLRIDLGVSGWFPGMPTANFEIATDGTNQLLFCNETVVTGVYCQRVTDPNRFDPMFTAAFADALAAAVALPITQKLDLAARLEGKARDSFERAAAQSANEQTTDERYRVAASIAVRDYDDVYCSRINWGG